MARVEGTSGASMVQQSSTQQTEKQDPKSNKKYEGDQYEGDLKSDSELFKAQLQEKADGSDVIRYDVMNQSPLAVPDQVSAASAVDGPEAVARADLTEQMRISAERVLASTDGKEIRVDLKSSLLPDTSFTLNTGADGKLIFNFDTSSSSSAAFLERNTDNMRQALLEQLGTAAEVKVTRRDDDSGGQGQSGQSGQSGQQQSDSQTDQDSFF